MAALSNPVSKQNIVDRFADYVAGSANSGISWGTNVYPFPEFSHGSIFGGGTGGKGIEISGGNIATNAAGEITAQYVYDTLITETYRYTKIRKMRARLFVTGDGGNSGSRPTAGWVYDQTAVAFLNDSYLQGVSAGRDNVYGGNIITAGGLEAMFSNMRGSYNSLRENVAGTWETSVCHASCHSSCHGSRGRR